VSIDAARLRATAVNIHSFDGMKKVILAFLREGDYFGEMALIKPGLYRSATVETAQLTKLYALRRRDFQKLMMDNPTLAFHLLGDTMERLRKANRQMYDLTLLNVRTRIIKRLIRLSEEYGVAPPQGVRLGDQQLPIGRCGKPPGFTVFDWQCKNRTKYSLEFDIIRKIALTNGARTFRMSFGKITAYLFV